ncbi:MAG: TIM barrel protein [Synechococcales bacterium]|nr:TIM barrel protein [Synechococcales bacterium]
MSTQTTIALQTKSCVETLGVEDGLTVAVEAGIESVVFWAGEEGEFIEALGLWQDQGLNVLSVALPKLNAYSSPSRQQTEVFIQRVHEFGVPAVGLIFGDQTTQTPSTQAQENLFEWARNIDLTLILENSGRMNERFSSLHEIERFLESVPGSKMALDVGHLASSGQGGANPSHLKERIVWVEVHDNNGVQDLHLPLGFGSGVGAFQFGMKSLGWTPERIVIETNPQIDRNLDAWVRAVRSDKAQIVEFLGNAVPV